MKSHIRGEGRASLVLLSASWLLTLAGCAPIGPNFEKPQAPVPAEWVQPALEGLTTAPGESVEWWRLFKDPVLDELVERARRDNNSLEIAGLRVLEARAQLGIATGFQFPQSQVAAGSTAYISAPDNSGVTSGYWQSALGASAAWEIDFWGRFRRGIESADAAFMASIAAYDQAQVILIAAVVDLYTVVRGTEEQLRISRENAIIQKRSYDIAQILYEEGNDSELDMQQAKTLLLSTQATIPGLEISLAQSRNALSTLLGRTPGAVDALLEKGSGIPAPPASIEVGIPADMLRRRPDVRQAEFQAMAQNAQIGLAQADLYPSFSLTGSIGVSADTLGDASFGDLFSADAFSWTVGPQFVWPFLNYGRIKNNVRVQDARLQQALVNYRETVLQAAREAEDAMASYIGSRKQYALLAQTVESAMRSNELSTLRYSEGFSGYERVLNAQQALFAQQQRLVTSQGAIVRSLVALYKALGGGWENHEGLPYLAPETLEAMQKRTDWGDLIERGYPDNEDQGPLRKADG